MKKIYFIFALLLIGYTSQSQVLISLLLGDKLNSDKIEFGLLGGLNRSYWTDISESEGMNNFNIGFYFHLMLNENSPTSFISTGVLVKSNVGAEGMPTYPIGDTDFDKVFADGKLKTQVNYFYVPMMYQQRFNNRWYMEAGIQSGLRSKAYDTFETKELDGDVSYKLEVSDQYNRLDFGFVGGAGYKLRKQLKSSAIGINYYYGVVNVSTRPGVKKKNSSIYFYCKIPIGVKKAEQKK